MKRLLTAIVLVLLSPIVVFAQGLSIDGPTEPIEPRQPVWLTIVGVEEGTSAVFFPSDQIQAGPPHIMPMSALFWADKAGTYRANAIVVDWTKQTLTPLTYSITVEGEDGPDPPPPPPPPPPPSESLTGLLVYEAEDLDDNPQFAKVLVSTRLRMIDKFAVRPFDVNVKNERGETPTTLQPWLKIITDNNWQLPQLLLVNEAGDLVAHKTPANVDDAIAFVKENLK